MLAAILGVTSQQAIKNLKQALLHQGTQVVQVKSSLFINITIHVPNFRAPYPYQQQYSPHCGGCDHVPCLHGRSWPGGCFSVTQLILVLWICSCLAGGVLKELSHCHGHTVAVTKLQPQLTGGDNRLDFCRPPKAWICKQIDQCLSNDMLLLMTCCLMQTNS